MKSFAVRIFPCWMLVMVLRTILRVDYTFFAVVQTLAFAFAWAFIHEVYDRKTATMLLWVTIPLIWVGSFVNLGLFRVPGFIKLIMEAFGIFMVVYAIKRIREDEFKRADNIRSRNFQMYNIYEYRRVRKICDVPWKLVNAGAKELGVSIEKDYYGTPAVFDEFRSKIRDLNYRTLQYGKSRCIVHGRDGLAVLRILDEPGDYEFKNNKWYKDGKKYINISEEAEKILEMLDSVWGVNKVIIVKAFEGGSVKGSGCGYFVTDITKGYDKLIEAIKKITRTEGISSKADKKLERIQTALGVR